MRTEGSLPDIYHFVSITTASEATISTCVSNNHGLLDGEQITLFDAGFYDGIYAIKRMDENTFTIAVALDDIDNPATAKWIRGSRYQDPYSLMMTYVFPTWGDRFENPEFRETVESIVRAETPAHIAIFVRWFGVEQMGTFEALYQQWLQEKRENDPNLDNSSNALMEMLM